MNALPDGGPGMASAVPVALGVPKLTDRAKVLIFVVMSLGQMIALLDDPTTPEAPLTAHLARSRARRREEAAR